MTQPLTREEIAHRALTELAQAETSMTPSDLGRLLQRRGVSLDQIALYDVVDELWEEKLIQVGTLSPEREEHALAEIARQRTQLDAEDTAFLVQSGGIENRMRITPHGRQKLSLLDQQRST